MVRILDWMPRIGFLIASLFVILTIYHRFEDGSRGGFTFRTLVDIFAVAAFVSFGVVAHLVRRDLNRQNRRSRS